LHDLRRPAIEQRLEPHSRAIELIDLARRAMHLRKGAELVGGQRAVELGLALARDAIERSRRHLHLRRQLIVAKEEDRAANALQIVFEDEILEKEIPVRDRTALLIE